MTQLQHLLRLGYPKHLTLKDAFKVLKYIFTYILYTFFFLPKEKKMPILQKISSVFWEKKNQSP